MDKAQKVEYEENIDSYIESNQIPDYFEELTKQLIINQPVDSIQFLIDYLEQRKKQRIILIHGVIPAQRDEIAKSLSNQLNYKLHIVESAEKDIKRESDEILNQKIDSLIENTESYFKGIILSGYPNTYRQVQHIRKHKKQPERMFVIKHSQEDLQKYYGSLYNNDVEQIKAAIERDQIDLKEIIGEYGSYCDIFEITDFRQNSGEIAKNMTSILKIKDTVSGKNPPLRSPRVIILSPPYLRKRALELLENIAKKFGFYKIDVESLIQKHIESKTEVGKYLFRNISMRQEIPLEILSSLVQTEIYKSVAKLKGWVLLGFPSNIDQINVFKSQKVNPNLVISLQENEGLLSEQYGKLLVDPIFGKRYESGVTNQRDIVSRLRSDDTFSQEEKQKTIQEYSELNKYAEETFNNKFQKFTLSTEDNSKIIHSVDIHLNNPNNY